MTQLYLPQAAKMPADKEASQWCYMCKHYSGPDLNYNESWCKLHNIEVLPNNWCCADFEADEEHAPLTDFDYEPNVKYDQDVYHGTDMGNADWFLITNNGNLRYCAPWDKWLIWNNKIWKIDEDLEILRRAKRSFRYIYQQAGLMDDDKERKKIASYAITCEANNKLSAAVSLARSDVPIMPDKLDVDRYLLTVDNGTINLRTCKLERHFKEDYITKMAPVRYVPGATCPKWLEFLDLIFNGNQDLIRFVQKGLGYSLTGDVGEQVIFILWGTGNNGKSTFINAVSKILGVDQYAKRTPSESLMVKKYEDDKRNDLAALKSVRFVSCSEGEEGRRLNESIIKDITGGDPISCRFLHKEFFTYWPAFKVWYATNHKPLIVGTDPAIWRRIMLLEFTVCVPEALKLQGKEKIANYEEVLIKDEGPGILNWMLEGCLLWQKEGLKPPEAVLKSNEAYKTDMDILQGFIDECCIIEKGLEIKHGDLYKTYTKWCDSTGVKPLNIQSFATRLDEKGYVRKIGRANVRYRLGLSLKPEFLPGQTKLNESSDKGEELQADKRPAIKKYSSSEDQLTRYNKINTMLRVILKDNAGSAPVMSDIEIAKSWYMSIIEKDPGRYCEHDLDVGVLKADILQVLRDKVH